jgi:hypothetical protein
MQLKTNGATNTAKNGCIGKTYLELPSKTNIIPLKYKNINTINISNEESFF